MRGAPRKPKVPGLMPWLVGSEEIGGRKQSSIKGVTVKPRGPNTCVKRLGGEN